MFTIEKSKKSPVKSLCPGDEDNSVNHKGLIKRNLNNDELKIIGIIKLYFLSKNRTSLNGKIKA